MTSINSHSQRKFGFTPMGTRKPDSPPHGFDFTREDTDKMLKAIRDSHLYKLEKIARILRGDKK